MPPEIQKAVGDVVMRSQESVFFFIEESLGLVPQEPKTHARARFDELFTCDHARFEELADSFKLDDFETFKKGKHITWQQTVLLIAYMRALNDTLPRRIVVKSSRGNGKSFIASVIIYHFLYSYSLALIMATAPTSDQMFAALWKEANVVLSRMKSPFKECFEWQAKFIRHREQPEAWFARAKTAENTEALSGIHSDHMISLIDEMSGVDEDVIDTGWATMTNENKLLIGLTNPTRIDGRVFDVFNENDMRYVKITFNGEESPVINQKELEIERKQLMEKGVDPYKDAKYRIDRMGEFPIMDDALEGFYRLFSQELIERMVISSGDDKMIEAVENDLGSSRCSAGVDPSGAGSDITAGAVRGYKFAKIAFKQQVSTSSTVASAILMMLDRYNRLSAQDVFVDAFGIGHDVSQKVMEQSPRDTRYIVSPVQIGEQVEPSEYRKRYVNLRAAVYDAMRVWGESGGKILCDDPELLKKELKSIYAQKTTTHKLKIMGKEQMKKNKLPSPNLADAVSLTFAEDFPFIIDGVYTMRSPMSNVSVGGDDNFDRFSAIPM